MREFFNEVKKYAGPQAEIRFVGLAEHIRERFERARPGWALVESDAPLVQGNSENERKEILVRVFPTVSDAIAAGSYSDLSEDAKNLEKSSSRYNEKV